MVGTVPRHRLRTEPSLIMPNTVFQIVLKVRQEYYESESESEKDTEREQRAGNKHEKIGVVSYFRMKRDSMRARDQMSKTECKSRAVNKKHTLRRTTIKCTYLSRGAIVKPARPPSLIKAKWACCCCWSRVLIRSRGWTKTQAQNPETAPPSRWVTGSLAFCFDGIFEVYVSCGVFICVYVM